METIERETIKQLLLIEKWQLLEIALIPNVISISVGVIMTLCCLFLSSVHLWSQLKEVEH